MFPTPIEKTSRPWQLTYQSLLPLALIMWLLPLIAVAIFSIKPAEDFALRDGRSVHAVRIAINGLMPHQDFVAAMATLRGLLDRPAEQLAT